jgi:ATP-binding cassette subfamily A (ABC1) protein 1
MKDELVSPTATAYGVIKADLSTRRTTWTYIKALLWKNFLIKRRHYVATLLEILLPTFFILLMGVLKNLTDDVGVPSGWSDDKPLGSDDSLGTSYNLYQSTGSSISWVLTTLPKFNMYESTLTGLLMLLGQQSVADGLKLDELSGADYVTCVRGVTVFGEVSNDTSSPYRVPEACAGKISPYKIAIAPDNTFTREYFMQTMNLWYPRINILNSTTSPQVPSFEESVVFYKTAEDLEEYVKSNEYGDGIEQPRIYGAIVFDSIPQEDAIGSFSSVEYTLRLNSTLGRQGAIGRVPRTLGDPPQISPFQRKINVDYYSRYAVTGFMTLQTLVTRFVTCMPEWDASTKTTTGVCQRPQATANSTDELDLKLISTLDNDALIKFALSSFAAASAGTSTNTSAVATDFSFTNILAMMTDATKEALLKPLRQAPQPYLGASVAPFPVETYISSPFYDQVEDVFAIVFILAYLYAISRVLVVFIQEKESRMREL